MTSRRASLVAYWSLFAEEARAVAGAPALINTRVPILETNAAYPDDPGQLEDIDLWYASLGRPAAVVLPEGTSLELAANNAGFRFEGGFALLEVSGPLDHDPAGVWVEQVPWSLGSRLGPVLARAHGMPDWGDLLAAELARVMQAEPELTALLAFVAGEPAGMLLEAGGAAHLWGVTRAGWRFGAVPALLERAAGPGVLEVAVPLDWLGQVPAARELERFSVWVRS